MVVFFIHILVFLYLKASKLKITTSQTQQFHYQARVSLCV